MTEQELNKKISKLNKEIRSIKDVYGTSATQLGKYSDISSGILIPSGTNRSGEFRTLNEVNKYIEKHFGAEYKFSQADYEERLNKIIKMVGDRTTLEGEERYQRGRIESLADDIEQATGERLNFDDLTVEEINDIFREANDRNYKKYINWYDRVVQVYEERYGE